MKKSNQILRLILPKIVDADAKLFTANQTPEAIKEAKQALAPVTFVLSTLNISNSHH